MKHLPLIALLTLPACEAVLLPFDTDTTGTVGRQINSVYDAERRMIDGRCGDGTITPDCHRIFKVEVE